ncbi:MAG: PAS domain-containing protein, partial [Methylomonas sp.]|nr:PAS domain-containing protein [Methylomonas sp.]
MMSYRYRWQDLLALLGLALVYAAVAKVVLSHFSEAGNVTLIWFSGGIALSVLLINGLKYWPGIFVGAFVAGSSVGDPFWMSCIIAIGNTLESVIAAWWLSRTAQFSNALNRPWHFFRLTYVAACCSLISAALGSWAIWWGDGLPASALPYAMLHWWMADVFGIVFTTPVLLIWRRWPREWFRPARLFETLAFIGFCLFFGQLVFLELFQFGFGKLAHGYWLYLGVTWGALRFGRHGVMLVSCIVVVLGLFGAAHHRGWFADDFQQTGMLNFWFYTAILSWTGTHLVLTLQSNLVYAQGLRSSRRRLQAIIDASPIPIALNNGTRQITLLNPAFIRTLGYTLDDIPHLEDWWHKAYPDPDYRQSVKDQWRERLEQAKQTGLPFQAFQNAVQCKNGEIRYLMVGAGPLEGAGENEYMVTLMDMTEQVAAHKALSDSNVLLQTILETLPLRVFWKDKRLRYLGANSLFARDAGVESVDELLGKSDRELDRDGGLSGYQVEDQLIIESGQGRVGYEEPLTLPDGERIWLRSSKLPLRNGEQEVIGVLGMYEDITLQKRIDDQLLWRTAFLETLLEATPDGILAVDADGNKLLQNQRLIKLWEIPDEIARQADDSVQLEFVKNQTKDPQQFLEKVLYLYAHPDETCSDEVVLKNGTILQRFSAPVQDRMRHCYGRIWYFTDVTDMREAERSIRLQAFYQRSLLDNFPFMVWLKDRDSRYLAVNKTFAETWGVDTGNVIGKTDFDIFPLELAKSHREADQAVIESRRQQNLEEQAEIGGRRGWVETYKAPLIDESGEVLGTVGFSRDISPRKEAEDAINLAALV